MPITSSTLTGLRAGVVAVLEAIPGLTVYDHEPRALTSLPGATVEFAGFERQAPELAEGRVESALGTVDLLTRWTIRLYVDIGTKSDEVVSDELLELVAAAIGGYDADETLDDHTADGVVWSSVLADSGPPLRVVREGSEREMVMVEATCVALSEH